MRSAVLAVLIFLLAYPFVLYPVLVSLLARHKRRRGQAACQRVPDVALIICALNEQRIIKDKIENSLALRYPKGQLAIVVVSDGSSDRTAELVREYSDKGVLLIDQPTRRGKVCNLNEVIPTRPESIIVLSDANVMYHHDALLRLVAPFDDAEIGCVSGKVILTDTTPDLDSSTREYYSIEWKLQEDASTLHSMPGADGAMYAIRRELFQVCPSDTLIEDFVIPMQIVAAGKRAIFEASAVGWERGVMSLREEYRRKVRIAAGAWQSLRRGNGWPRNAPLSFWFVFVSHKLLRWCSPLLAALLLVLSFVWSGHLAGQILLAFTAILLGLALLRIATGWTHSLFSAPFYFVFSEVALGAGLLKGITNSQSVLWAKADR